MPKKEVLSRAERKGKTILRLLDNPSKLTPEILLHPAGIGDDCLFFSGFPRELSEAFHGSYIAPETFLSKIGIDKKDIEQKTKDILGDQASEKVYGTVFQQEIEKTNFQLKVWNGSTNTHARELSRLAARNNYDTSVTTRAEFQDALMHTSQSMQKDRLKNRGQAVRIHDDCLASGDSIVGFIAAVLNGHGDEKMMKRMYEHGVDIIIDGPATAQGILFLQKFAEKYEIKLRIDVGYMAFGLSEGSIGDAGVREHANYITYPEPLLEKLPSHIAKELASLSNGTDIQVVGDMGKAQRGIKHNHMKGIRIQKNDNDYCKWNDYRTDPHGEHPNASERLGDGLPNDEDLPEDVYFPNGGYLPAEWDRLIVQLMKYDEYKSKRIFVDAARTWLSDVQFGAAYYPEGKKPKE